MTVGCIAITDQLALGEHQHPGSDLSHHLHVMRRQHDRMPGSSQLAQDRHQPTLGAVVQTPRRLVEQQERRSTTQYDGQRQTEPLSLGQVPRMHRLVDIRCEPIQ